MCALRFWLLWETLSSPHKRPTTYEMEIQFSFVKGLNTKTLRSLVHAGGTCPSQQSFHRLPTAARVKQKAREAWKVLMHKMPTNRRGGAPSCFFPSIVCPRLLLASQLKPFVLLSRDWEKTTAAQAVLIPCDSDYSSYPAI